MLGARLNVSLSNFIKAGYDTMNAEAVGFVYYELFNILILNNKHPR